MYAQVSEKRGRDEFQGIQIMKPKSTEELIEYVADK